LGKIWGDRISPKAVWHVVKAAAKRAAPVRGYVTWEAESLSRFNSCLATYRLRQLNGISAASRDSAMR
jgi:hypothetical protein